MPNNYVEVSQKVTHKWGMAYKWKALATVALGTMMGTMDASITNISFPILTKTFGVSVTTIVWVSLAYILASTSLMLILGRVGDLLGRKRIFIERDPYFYIRINTLCFIPKCNPADHFPGYSGRRRGDGHGLQRGYSHRSLSAKRKRPGTGFVGCIGLRRFNQRSGPGRISPGMVPLAFYLLCKDPLRTYCGDDGHIVSKKGPKESGKDKI